VTAGLRILMPSIYFPPRVGGIESHVYYLARELVRRGHGVHVVTTHTEPGSPWKETVDGIEVTRLMSFGKHFLGWSLGSLSSVPEIVRLAGRCDMIHCHTFASALGGTAAALLYGRPLVVTVHSSHFLKLARHPVMRQVMRILLARAGALLSTSVEIDEVVRRMLPGAYTVPIVNGIDTETFKPSAARLERPPGVFVIVCPRRLVAKNGVEYLVRALPLVKREMPVKVYLAGDGPLRRRLEETAASLGVGGDIEFMGSVENAGMPGVYSSADLVVIPSLIEATSSPGGHVVRASRRRLPGRWSSRDNRRRHGHTLRARVARGRSGGRHQGRPRLRPRGRRPGREGEGGRQLEHTEHGRCPHGHIRQGHGRGPACLRRRS